MQRDPGVAERRERGQVGTVRAGAGDLPEPDQPVVVFHVVAAQPVREDRRVGGRAHPPGRWPARPLPGVPHDGRLGERLIEPALQDQGQDRLAGRHVRLPGRDVVVLGHPRRAEGVRQVARGHRDLGEHM